MAVKSLRARLYALVVCQVNAFLGASDCQIACELRLARTRHESHDSHISSGALEYFFSDGFPYFVAPAFSTPAFSATPTNRRK